MSDEPQLNPELPFKSLSELVKEANNLPIEPYEYDVKTRDVVVLVLDRASVEFEHDDHPEVGGSALDYETLRIKSNPHILAVAALDRNGVVHNAQRRIGDFPNRIQQKALLAFKALIGSFGIYPFKRIWALTTPLSWRDESDIDLNHIR
jgi:hypothetical protein